MYLNYNIVVIIILPDEIFTEGGKKLSMNYTFLCQPLFHYIHVVYTGYNLS